MIYLKHQLVDQYGLNFTVLLGESALSSFF